MTAVSPGSTNLENVTPDPGDLELEVPYVPAGITTPEVVNYPPGLTKIMDRIREMQRDRDPAIVNEILRYHRMKRKVERDANVG